MYWMTEEWTWLQNVVQKSPVNNLVNPLGNPIVNFLLME